ncbi:TetR/AcrR family transcriptional regulator [Mycolicibacterium sp. CH28]|uniref:TetR/AcrR family transcriptional regulator n=1 Tax=Mycolicibacterium sp. CH28 TaxID=2512237 RepID=UPI001082045B|nr:TetR/AcrR family transcriptional regulator [Mycolicibacterium sp. CH28]TGD88527.1 TetR/AcrR family transcriptional regulator [Mycolicibacterium sp. CH28]
MTSVPRRADAAQNRARIVESARALVVRPGELKLNEVAKAAGVGQGTLYRHFPTRDELLVEVYRADVESLAAAVPELLADHPPLEALEGWLRRLAEYARVKRGVFAAVTATVRSDLAGHSAGSIAEAITLLLDAAKVQGVVRSDVDARDVVLLLGALMKIDDDEWDTRAGHLIGIILAGLRG